MHNLVQRLIEEERRAGNHSATDSRAAFRVCEKLRRPLSTFAGTAGFRSLLSRALTLARAKASLLDGVQILPDGSFQYSAEFEAQSDSKEGAAAGAILTGQLAELLITFIGEALTLRLVHDVWPNVATKNSKNGGK